MAKEAINEARNEVRSRCICFVRPSNMGKSHTAYIISRDLDAQIIPVMSVTEQATWFKGRIDNPIFILDDPSDWYRPDDRLHVFSILKNLTSGYLRSGRATKYDLNIPYPLEKKVCVILFMNSDQYNRVRSELDFTGLRARLNIFLTKHDAKTINYIDFEYSDKEYSATRLPKFKDNGITSFDKKFLESERLGTYYNEVVEFE